MEKENWLSMPREVMENRQMGESHGKVKEFEISLKPDFFVIYSVMFRDCRQLWNIYFFNTFIHLLYIYHFYLKMVMKFGNFSRENSWKSHEMVRQASCGNPVCAHALNQWSPTFFAWLPPSVTGPPKSPPPPKKLPH